MRGAFASWNAAAVNSNPFEHYAAPADARAGAGAFMRACEFALGGAEAGGRTFALADVLTEARLDVLEGRLARAGAWGRVGARAARRAFERDAGGGDAGGFLRDGDVGAKRLCSMPDRVTNTVRTVGGGVMCRPTVINCYGERMRDEDDWFERWVAYAFDARATSADGTSRSMIDLMVPIKRAKYPAISEEEEALGIPLQVFYLAAFDGAWVRFATLAAGSFDAWQDIRASLVDDLVTHKFSRTLDVVEKLLLSADAGSALEVCFMQEVGASLADALRAREGVRDAYEVLCPSDMDVKRDQNSIVIVSKAFIKGAPVVEATSDVLGALDASAAGKFSKGDFCAFLVRGVLLCSYHGDTDGLQTKTITAAVHEYCERNEDVEACVFGMDANTHSFHREGKKQGVRDFIDFIHASTSFKSCWTLADIDVERDAMTTFSARTFLQAQLNKAVPFAEVGVSELTDRHPKDHVLVRVKSGASVREATVDRINAVDFAVDPPKALPFDADAMFPNARFPSDHAAVVFRCLLPLDS